MLSPAKLSSPVPKYTVVQIPLGAAPHDIGSTAIAPTATVGMFAAFGGLSVSGAQVLPPSMVTQRPPSAPPRYTLFELFGFAASAVTRPDVNGGKKGELVGCGPIENQAEVGPLGGGRKPDPG